MLSFTFLHGSSFRGTITGVSDTFIQACKAGTDYACNCCNRLMYRKTVTEFSAAKYHKAPTQILAATTSHSPQQLSSHRPKLKQGTKVISTGFNWSVAPKSSHQT